MKSFFLLILAFYYSSVFSQKPAIDSTTLKNWAGVGGESISPDGKYVGYNVYQRGQGARSFLESFDGAWKKEITGADEPRFSADGKLVFFKRKDSLCLLTPGTDHMVIIGGVGEYAINKSIKNSWLVYRVTTKPEVLVLRNLENWKESQVLLVSRFMFSPDGNQLLLSVSNDSLLQILDLNSGKTKTIWQAVVAGEKTEGWLFNPGSNGLVFMVGHEVWYCQQGMDKAEKLFSDDQIVNGSLEFSKDGQNLFFGLLAGKPSGEKKEEPGVDIWSYADAKLMSVQQREAARPIMYTSVINLKTKNVVRLQKEFETIVGKNNGYALIKYNEAGSEGRKEYYWNKKALTDYFLVSLKDGSRKLIEKEVGEGEWQGIETSISPDGKWLIWFDRNENNYFTYEIATGEKRNITGQIRVSWVNEMDDHPDIKLAWGMGSGTWTNNDEAVLISDSYDIWQIDPEGKKPAICLTNGFGRKENTSFETIGEGGFSGSRGFILKNANFFYVRAINHTNKDRGFYKIHLNKSVNPELCSMGPWVYSTFQTWQSQDEYNFPPQRAKSVHAYIVSRMSATNAPNLFVTSDFKNYRQLTDVQPQKKYNWYTTEPVHLKTKDGIPFDGILYKPENFDAEKKYPVLFHYYEKRTEELNIFLQPGYSEGHLNIPWFVSNGYLIFVPDIHYKIGYPGESALQTVLASAEYLSSKPWVDSKHMGLQGHSFGGYETDYIITHSDLFAAACSAAGLVDLISQYGSDLRGSYGMWSTEKAQERIGATPWQRPDLFISNSPIYQADKVTTPLLMFNNHDDTAVPFAQGVEFFMALRRLGKKVWMLQYDGEGHSLGGPAAEDFHYRMIQFFDHYLKDAPAPDWMTKPSHP